MPGVYVSQKAGLNRCILQQGRREFRRQTRLQDRRARRDADRRRAATQLSALPGLRASDVGEPQSSVFRCFACGDTEHADVHAARSILADATQAAGPRRGACRGSAQSLSEARRRSGNCPLRRNVSGNPAFRSGGSQRGGQSGSRRCRGRVRRGRGRTGHGQARSPHRWWRVCWWQSSSPAGCLASNRSNRQRRSTSRNGGGCITSSLPPNGRLTLRRFAVPVVRRTLGSLSPPRGSRTILRSGNGCAAVPVGAPSTLWTLKVANCFTRAVPATRWRLRSFGKGRSARA